MSRPAYAYLNKNKDLKMQAVSSKKRLRGENWAQEDKILLKELVRERVKIIENKNTDTNTNASKMTAWHDLQNSFNAMCKGVPRTLQQLKAQWNLLKMAEKKYKCAQRKQINLTGGGPPPVIAAVSSEEISSWLPGEFTTDSNEFDSDCISQTKIPPAAGTFLSDPGPSKPRTQDLVPQNPTEPSICEENFEKTVELVLLPATTSPEPEDKTDEIITAPIPLKKNIRQRNIKKKVNAQPTPAEKIMAQEIECRKELHSIQMQNELQKKKNLKLKEILLLEKIKYYKSKNE